PGDDDGTATVSVFHGIPGMTVDVYANGDELLGDFEPGTVPEPQQLDAGTYDIQIFRAGQNPDGAPALEKEIAAPAAAAPAVPAHLHAAGKPGWPAFVTAVSPAGAGPARLTERHVAAAPAVDVRAGGQPVLTGLENPKE